jgi:hypothetical protein
MFPFYQSAVLGMVECCVGRVAAATFGKAFELLSFYGKYTPCFVILMNVQGC